MNEALFRMVVLIIVSSLRLVVAVPLLLTARRNRLNNLYWLSAQFFCLVIAVPFAETGTIGNNWIFWTFISLSEIALILFIHTTFYQGRSSPMPLFIFLAIVGLIGGLYGNATDNFTLSAWFVYPNAILIWVWHTIVAYQGFQNVRTERDTEDWVKSRYRLMITYSILDILSALGGTLATTGLFATSFSTIIVVLLNFSSVIVQILVWVMPESFRRWLNRNQKANLETRTDAEALAILRTLGAAMSNNSGLTQMVCGFAIRTVVGKRIGSEDSRAIHDHINQMGYQEWVVLLERSDFQSILTSRSGPSANVKGAIASAKQVLVDRQSVFTLMAK